MSLMSQCCTRLTFPNEPYFEFVCQQCGGRKSFCKASIVSVIYVVFFTQNAELFAPKNSVFHKCGTSANAKDSSKKEKEKIISNQWDLNPGLQNH